MVGLARLANVRECAATALADGVPGDLVETGVWRGGTSIHLRAILAALGDDIAVPLIHTYRLVPSSAARPVSASASHRPVWSVLDQPARIRPKVVPGVCAASPPGAVTSTGCPRSSSSQALSDPRPTP